jgi:methyltransferase-like protein
MDRSLSPEAVQQLKRFSGGGRTDLEQYGDFFGCRLFRQTLLCRDHIALDAEFKPERLRELHVQSPAKPVAPQPDLRSAAVVKFRSPAGEEVESGHPLAKMALCVLGERFPEAFSFSNLLTDARARLGAPPTVALLGDDTEAAELAEFLFIADAVQFVKLVTHVPTWTRAVSERPIASPLVRWQVATGRPVTNVWHHLVKLEDSLLRHCLSLLDGARDHPALVEALAQFMAANEVFIKQGQEEIRDPVKVRQILAAALPSNVAKFARLGLLVG